MVSQPSMQKTRHLRSCLGSVTLLLLLTGGCGQNDGGRCQVTSDCADGLVCSEGTTGNGICKPAGTPGTIADAAIKMDVAEDLAPAPGPEVAPDMAENALDTGVADTSTSESGPIDSTGID